MSICSLHCQLSFLNIWFYCGGYLTAHPELLGLKKFIPITALNILCSCASSLLRINIFFLLT